MHPLPKENRDEQIFIGLAAGRPGDRADHHLSHIQLANRRYAIELIGWASAAILLLTINRQVFTQWRDRSTRGLLRWLSAGQIAASSSTAGCCQLGVRRDQYADAEPDSARGEEIPLQL